MATQKYTFEGKVKFAFLTKVNKFGVYSINFYPKDDATRKAIKATGIRSGLKEDEDGFFYTLRKDPNAKYNGGPVTVVDTTGQPVTTLIGDGSSVIVDYDVYDYNHPVHGQGKGGRIVKVTVTNLIPYEAPAENTATPPAEAEASPPKRKPPF